MSINSYVTNVFCSFNMIFIFSHFDWICCNRNRGCVYECVCVRLCVTALLLKRLCRFWWNFARMIWQIFTCVIFFDFWKFKFDDVMAAILHFSYGALSRSQFLSDFLQIWIQVTKLFFTVCYWKSAKSVDKFRRYNGTKNTKFPPKIKFSNLDTKGIILC